MLDYSAKTGVDAVSATQKLLIGVDNGGKGLKRIGVAYQATGKFSADLSLATEALEKRFTGSAATAAASMAGQMESLAIQEKELAVQFGKFISMVEQKTGIVPFLTKEVKAFGGAINDAFSDKTGAAAGAEILVETKQQGI